MEQIENLLSRLGLSRSEIKVYLAGLPYPAISASDLSKLAAMKRPTVYHTLETLAVRGLVAKTGSENRVLFTMTPPENLQTLLTQQMGELEERQKALGVLIPLLAGQRASTKLEHARVVQYEGIEGIKLVVEEALYCRSRRWDILAPRKNFFSEFDKEYAKYFLTTRQRREIVARSLWELMPDGKKKTPSGNSLTAEDMRLRNPRYLPKVMHGTFTSVIIIFDDKVALISSYKNLFAMLIQSKEIQEMMTAMFEGLWSVSEKYTD